MFSPELLRVAESNIGTTGVRVRFRRVAPHRTIEAGHSGNVISRQVTSVVVGWIVAERVETYA
jgi:hypothetical protein